MNIFARMRPKLGWRRETQRGFVADGSVVRLYCQGPVTKATMGQPWGFFMELGSPPFIWAWTN
jgi:hypothetical protein